MRVTVHKRNLSILVTAILVIIAVWFVSRPHIVVYHNCQQLYEIGQHDIPRSSPYYLQSLDRDHDGHACEL